MDRRTSLGILAALFSGSLKPAAAEPAADITAETIAIIGTGEVGSALGKRWAGLGQRVTYGSRTPHDPRVKDLVTATGPGTRALDNRAAAESCDLVVLAIPWRAARAVVESLGPLDGKIVIDPTNAVHVVEGQFLTPDDMAATSGGEQLQSWLPAAQVVKAFNALSADTMASPAPGPVSVPMAGGDGDAGVRVARLITAMGLNPVDVGPLYFARTLEAMARLRMTFHARNHPAGFDYYLQLRQDRI